MVVTELEAAVLEVTVIVEYIYVYIFFYCWSSIFKVKISKYI